MATDKTTGDGRYEVWYTDAQTGDEMLAGTTGDATGGEPMRVVRSWPTARHPKVVDTWEREYGQGGQKA